MPPPSRLATWLVLASPLVWIPGGLDRFVFPKLLLAALAVGFAALSPRAGMLSKPVALVAAAGLAWFTIACLASPTPVASLVGRWPRYEGLPTVLTYAGCAWAGARLLGNRTKQAVTDLVNAAVVAALALTAFALLAEAGVHAEGKSIESRAGSVLGNATDQGLVAMMLLALLVPIAVERRTPLLYAACGGALLTEILSGSRAALLVTVLLLALFVLQRRREVARFAVAGIGILVVGVLVVPSVRDRLGNSETITGRWLLWKESVHVGVDRWWAGGPSTFVDTVGAQHDREWVDKVGVANPPDSPHNWLLQALVAGGIPLLLLAVALGATIVLIGWRAVRDQGDAVTSGLFAAVLGYGVGLLPNFTIAGSTCLAAFLTGALVSVEAGRREARAVPVMASVASAAVAISFAAGALGERAIQQGIDHAAVGEASAAQDSFSRAHHLRPLDGDVQMFAAQAFAGIANRGGDGSARAAELAESWAHGSLRRTPRTYQSNLALAVAQISQGDLERARARLDRLVRWYPTEPDARIQLAIARFGLGDVPGARTELHLAMRLDPNDARPQQILDGIASQVQR